MSADARRAPSPVIADLLVDLRSIVRTYVRRRRDVGTPVQRVLPEVKALVREALVQETAPGERFDDPAELLLAQVVRWSIEAYYSVHDEALHVEPFDGGRGQSTL